VDLVRGRDFMNDSKIKWNAVAGEVMPNDAEDIPRAIPAKP
jgi:hypothetical protein